jgi:predicted lipoprotein with Yx(FWY)xxD motif
VSHFKPKSIVAGAVVVPLAALVIAGCGGGSSDHTGTSNPTPSPPPTAANARATMTVASTSLGKILVDSQGRSLYLFKKDAGKSTCSGECATAWPPLIAKGKPTAGGGAQASMLGTVKRDDGTMQVTYHGHPLYLFAGDQQPGQVSGEGSTAFGAPWLALSASGNQIAN